ncbi:uncharacterized protein LOC121735234 isoform X1 [Aricia agestis]|uniref:uncharacterized protein LOC121735234 isoform X1 n=1 Tax=Aricia agestis TaxID=91739 RepID=UPI001C20807D|nr:uncharacterized protein LOC121735234 isoform X1 [Aricia agestis]
MDRCVNYGIVTSHCNTLGRRPLNDENILSVIRQWLAPQSVSSNDHVCQACWDLAQNPRALNQGRLLGHRNICLRCGRSLAARVSHALHTNSIRESRIYNVIKEWIIPRTIQATSHICHTCWVAADRASVHMTSGPSTSSRQDTLQIVDPQQPDLPNVSPNVGVSSNQPVPSIVLSEYMRAVETERRCFIEGCQRTERYRVPLTTRKMLFNEYKYYIPENNRLCDQHLVIEAWDFLDSLRSNYVQTFTERHIYDMMSLKEVESTSLLQFENIGEMEDHVVHIWTGLNKEQFNQMFAEVPELSEISKAAVALAAYLMKLRTGDSNERLASLLKVSRTTLEKWIYQVRELLTEHFVPRNLGLNHQNRQQLVQKNLAIPKALFGSFEGVDTPIAIFDGTYCYVEKSSNYLYQKKTYSLHKYRNLMKPFLIVCTDGYIIDVLGPYPATTSDADIMKKEFQHGRPLREYFQEGDAFILDRGFRDSISLLNQCGYRTYVPASLEEGETQLSTIEANKSRAVTICRWVVEVVNGRFKRDFKLLRQNYFNIASKSFMKDFEVAACLLNKFHPPIFDREDAQEIIQEIERYMNTENELASFIISNNYNRRRANFETITVHSDNLNDFPQLSESELILISLGTYQIKQARSYYGEHMRQNDGFVIEVCREVANSLLRELSASNTSWLLRGRILSRHISRKTYYIYILVDSSRRGREAIVQHYCNCIVGRRTVGCCAHIMSIIWYLSWARYRNIVPPAQFLDDILIIIEEE